MTRLQTIRELCKQSIIRQFHIQRTANSQPSLICSRRGPITLRQSPPLLNSFPQLRDDFARVLGAEYCTTGNNDVCACIGSGVDCVLSQTAVDLDVELRVALAEGFDLGHHLRHELLAAEAGLDSHHEGHLESIVSPECRIRS
jgi:hypothetical protein